MRFNIEEINIGFQIIIYKTKNDLGQTIYYGLQDHGGIRLMRCTQDFEPQSQMKVLDENVWFDFEMPLGTSGLEAKVRDFIMQKQEEANKVETTL